MPELVGELPDGSSGSRSAAWKAPALKVARENPGQWVRCDGDHPTDAAYMWHWQRAGPDVLPDGFEVNARHPGAPAGRIFVYVRWVGDTGG